MIRFFYTLIFRSIDLAKKLTVLFQKAKGAKARTGLCLLSFQARLYSNKITLKRSPKKGQWRERGGEARPRWRREGERTSVAEKSGEGASD